MKISSLFSLASLVFTSSLAAAAWSPAPPLPIPVPVGVTSNAGKATIAFDTTTNRFLVTWGAGAASLDQSYYAIFDDNATVCL
jgi:hypothetical protein